MDDGNSNFFNFRNCYTWTCYHLACISCIDTDGDILFYKNPNIEFVIFTVLSIVFVIFTRPVLKKYLEDKKTNFSSKMVGQELKIEKVVDLESPKKEYEVRFKGVIWKGVSSEIFREGEIVKIEDFEGNKIILEKIKK